VKLHGKWGFISRDGNFLIEPKYGRVGDFNCGRALFSYSSDAWESKWGYMDISGNEIVPERLGPAHFLYSGGFWDFCDGLARIKVDGLFGYIDKYGTAAIQPMFDYARPFIDGTAAVGLSGKHRFIDKHGNFAGNVFDDIAGESKFSARTDSLPAKLGPKWGFINCHGEFLMEPVYESVEELEGGNGWCAHRGRTMSLVDDQGKIVLTVERKPYYGSFVYYSATEGVVELETSPGLREMPCRLILNTDGHRIFCEEEDVKEAGYFCDGACPVKVDDDAYYIDKKGKRITSESLVPVGAFISGRGIVQSGGLYGYIDNAGKLLTPVHFKFAHPYSDDYAHALTMDGNWQWIDRNGCVVEEPNFRESSTSQFLAWPFHKPKEEPYRYTAFREGLCCVELDGKYGFVDTKCHFVVPPRFEEASHFVNGLAAVKDGSGKYGFIDKTGTVVVPLKFDSVRHLRCVQFEAVDGLRHPQQLATPYQG
jgi:hypothetical protein